MSVNSLNDIWQAVLGVLGQNLTDTAISTWFEDCEPVEIDGSTLVLKTSSDFKRDIIVKRFAETIKKRDERHFFDRVHCQGAHRGRAWRL